MFLPTDIANQALDAAAVDYTIGDLEEGTRPAQVTLRAYGNCLRQLLRGANWAFARKQAPLTLLADATGQTPNVGSLVPPGPFIYEYAYPTDCMRARFIPWNLGVQSAPAPAGNITPPSPSAPVVTGLNQFPLGQRIAPAKFVVATDPNYPPDPQEIFWQVQGVSPAGRTVILTNVKDAQLVYTMLALYPSVWDPLFRAALVAYLASEIALPLAKDKKLGLQVRAEQIKIVRSKVTEARLMDGNESVASSDIAVDWMRARNSGGGQGWMGGPGWGFPGNVGYGWGSGWDSLMLADGAVF